MTSNPAGDIEIVLLAAGGSRRLGRPKQLERFGEASLLSHSSNLAAATGAVVHVVLGCRADEMVSEIDTATVNILINPDWESGIASSVRVGCEGITPGSRGVLFMLCDQPLVTADHLRTLMVAFGTEDKSIVATRYRGAIGVPAIFGRTHLAELVALRGDEGARSIIRCNPEDVWAIEFENAGLDVDTDRDIETVAEFLRNSQETR